MSGVPEQQPLPTGVVTFLFSDMEGSTRVLEEYGNAAAAHALERHHEIYEELIARNQGVIFETVGDAVYAAFARPPDALAAALDAHRALKAEAWEEIGGRLACRIAVHTGGVEARGAHYFGPPLFRCARLQALAHGEQTVVSQAAANLVNGSLPPGAQLLDRGIHRLKDLQEPEHVYELQHPDLRTEFPPLRSLDVRRHNLPVQLSSFIGRERELASVGELIRGHRLVTLLGPGGMGKTRLALQAAADQIDAFPDGAWFVDLSAVADAERIPAEIGAALSLREDPETSVQETLAAHLESKRLLLVLDNLEQLLPAGARPVADLVARAPEIHVLATSRRPLRIRGEREYDLAPLAAGTPNQADEVLPDAVALFLVRAREIRPDLVVDETTGPLIAEICNRLDGLPLAIELASSRLRIFSLEALHERLSQRLPVLTGGAADLPQRQQTLRATIAWSEELLSADERILFHHLGAFAGGFSLEGALAVMPEADAIAIEESLTALLEHSLIRRQDSPTEPRFSMLETIREYAHEQLIADGQDGVTVDRIADFLYDLARTSYDHSAGLRRRHAIERTATELPNIRVALQVLRDRGDTSRLPRLVAYLGRVWVNAGLNREGSEWIALASRALGDDASELRAALYRSEGAVLADAEPLRAAKSNQAAAAMYEAIDHGSDLAQSLVGASNALLNAGQIAEGRATAERARDVAREVGDLGTEAAAAGNVASADLALGRIDEAEVVIQRVNDIFRSLGDDRGVAISLGNLGDIAAMRAKYRESVTSHRLGLEAAERSADADILGWELGSLGAALGRVGEWQEGRPLLVRALAILNDSYAFRSLLESMAGAATLLAVAGDRAGAAEAWHLASSLATSLSIPIDDWLVAATADLAFGGSLPTMPDGVSYDAVSVDAAVARITDRLQALEELGQIAG
jgi:predicted ATPase/class 3 adenylate cyclase